MVIKRILMNLNILHNYVVNHELHSTIKILNPEATLYNFTKYYERLNAAPEKVRSSLNT